MTLTDCKCPNCGASVSTDICEYCGTKFPKHTDFVVNIAHDETPTSAALTLEYAKNTYEAYNELRGNGSSTKLWNDIKALPDFISVNEARRIART